MTRVFLHSEAGYAQLIRARDHELRADEPVADGGRDSGPAPALRYHGTPSTPRPTAPCG